MIITKLLCTLVVLTDLAEMSLKISFSKYVNQLPTWSQASITAIHLSLSVVVQYYPTGLPGLAHDVNYSYRLSKFRLSGFLRTISPPLLGHYTRCAWIYSDLAVFLYNMCVWINSLLCFSGPGRKSVRFREYSYQQVIPTLYMCMYSMYVVDIYSSTETLTIWSALLE